jgi:hypothetical protein
VFDETVTISGHWKLSVLSLIRAFMGACMRAMHAGTQNPLKAALSSTRPAEQHTNHLIRLDTHGYAESG